MSRSHEDVARVAAQVIADEGLDGASIRETASRMGVTIGTLTHHFRNREDLLLATFEAAVASGRERAEHAARDLTGTARLSALLSEALPASETSAIPGPGVGPPLLGRHVQRVGDDHLVATALIAAVISPVFAVLLARLIHPRQGLRRTVLRDQGSAHPADHSKPR